MSFPSLLAPQEEEKEIYPYRRVWRTAIIEVVILLVLTLIMALVGRFYKGTLTDGQRRLFAVVFACAPLALWMLFSYIGERRARQPRTNILIVVVLSGLAANAIGMPLVERVFTINDWLANASGTSRIIGYTLSVGMIQTFIQYAVIRYSVWPDGFRIRSDGIAYAIAAAVGYATVVNLNYAFDTLADPWLAALRISEQTLSLVAISTVIGYFLAELKLNRNLGVFWMPGAVMLAALLTGLAITFRGGLIVAGLSTEGTASTPNQGIAAAIFFVIFMFGSFYFLVNNADERTRLRDR